MVIAPFKLARASLFRHLMFEIFEVEVLLFQRESEYKEATERAISAVQACDGGPRGALNATDH
jgi:hypothetical protein